MPKKRSSRRQTADNQVQLPLLPLKDMVIFPRMVAPLMVGRPKSIIAVEESLASGRPLFLCKQIDGSIEDPGRSDLHDVGVAVNILQTLRMPDGAMKVVIEGVVRAELEKLLPEEAHLEAQVLLDSLEHEELEEPSEEDEARVRVALGYFQEFVRTTQRVSPDVVSSLRELSHPADVSDIMCAHLPLRVEERQELLECPPGGPRLDQISSVLMRELELQGIEQRVRDKVRDQMERNQREYFLQEQLRAIQQELGQTDEGSEYSELHDMIAKARMPKEFAQKALRELNRYERMPPMSPESAIIRTYLEWLCEIPWRKRTRESTDIERAQKLLDIRHCGLKKVKELILEFLAVRITGGARRKGPILCFVGPPGVGKTSLGQSIADATKRKFVRVSLGGIRDEAEIRGHRRTYIGALPGRIVQSIRRAGVKNPLFMLDEIDKMSMDFRGDPASALLEVLDPEQNKAFSDHYLEVDVDLSQVFFIATANSEYDIPAPLHDRMEIIRIPGYTSFEKEEIAEKHLVFRQVWDAGLNNALKFSPEAIREIIERYTREAGVRDLERRIGQVCRKVALDILTDKADPIQTMSREDVRAYLGPPEYSENLADEEPRPGVAVGLAWTQVGGDILHIETLLMKGKGNLHLTGHLGDVMKESAQAAHAYIRAHCEELGVPEDFYKDTDVHIHVPEGAIPKDGPSAGVALMVSMVSALRGIAPFSRMGMSGEITLRGRVLRVGGVKEKVVAAHRAGLFTIVLPRENERDVLEIPEQVTKELDFVYADNISDVLRIAYCHLAPDKEPTKPAKKAASRSAKKPAKKASTRGKKS